MYKFERGQPTIGVLAGWQVYAGSLHSYLGPIYQGIQSAARDKGCNLLLACGVSYCPAWPDISRDSDFVPVGPWNTDGLLVVTPVMSEERSRYIHDLIEAGHPVVFIGTGETGPAVILDNEEGIRQAVGHLAKHGHRRIVYITGSVDEKDGDDALREKAFHAAIQEYGLEDDPGLIVYGRIDFEGGRKAMQQILDAGVPFTAVLANNDEAAMGAMHVLKGAGLRIPDFGLTICPEKPIACQ